MTRTLLSLSLLAALSAAPAHAQDAPDATGKVLVDAGRLAAMEARMAAMEAELARLKGEPAPGTPAPAAADQPDDLEALAAAPATGDSEALAAPASASAPSGGGANAFNPAISLILNGSLSDHSLDPEDYARAGFPLVGEGGPGDNGFSLGESELTLSANIDDKFYGQLTLAAESEGGEDEIAVEEAFVDTTALPHGLNVRVGRFFSNIGYLNSHHAHTDNFFDRPLAYQAFLGNQYGDDGVQLRWVAPTALFLELGAEVFRGESFPAGGAADNGLGTHTLFAHLGGDAGAENEWLVGLSMLRSKADVAEDGFRGDGRLYVADATWKWAPQGNFKDGGLTLRAEYFLDDRDGDYVDADDPLLDRAWNGQRRGAYLEAVYRINRIWDVGYRYDRLWADDGGPYASDFDPDRHSAALTWRNSEFSLLRLQVSRDNPNPQDSDTTVTLQYQTSLGAHGAHKF